MIREIIICDECDCEIGIVEYGSRSYNYGRRTPDSDEDLCCDCYSDYYDTCECCGNDYLRDNMEYIDYGTGYMCSDCFEKYRMEKVVE